MQKIINRQFMNKDKGFYLFCVVGLVTLFFKQELYTQLYYPYVYNPMQGFVNEAEKPYRDEVSLNGKWQFMPVF